MKRRIYIFLLAGLLCLSGCGQAGQEAITGWTAAQMAQAILTAQEQEEEMTALTQGEEAFEGYLADYYQIDPGQVEEGAVLYAGGVSALEIAVLRLTAAADMTAVQQALRAYIDGRAGAFTGYAPEQAAILERSTVTVRGRYAALFICAGQQEALKTFNACFEGAEPPVDEPAEESVTAAKADTAPWQLDAPEEPAPPAQQPPEEQRDTPEAESASEMEPVPEEDSLPEDRPAPKAPLTSEEDPAPEAEPSIAEEVPWRYDPQRLLSAWESGDWETGLGERDQAILQICAGVLAEVTGDGMSGYEKELAVHDWMIAWAEYDPGALSRPSAAAPSPDNDNPYGFLVDRVGICLGYASTFQLLMDLLDIECLTVEGTSHSGAQDHAWNMVRMEDGEWYCVDVTWDDPVSAGPVPVMTAHMYFNVTSDFLRLTNHQWDETQVPEATASAWQWQP